MTKKVFYLLLLTIIQNSIIYSQPSWEKIKTPTDFNLYKVVYLDSLHCWAAGDSGVIMFSADQGSTWEIQETKVSNYIGDIFFLNDSLGWAITFEVEGINFDTRSKILKTTDGGANWEIINFRHLNVFLTTVFFTDSMTGWVGGRQNGISFTSDGGYSWTEAYIDTLPFANFPIEQIKFSSDSYGFAVGGQVDNVGVAWSTSDAGLTWIPHGIGPDLFVDFIFLDSTSAIALTAELEGFYPTAILNFNLTDNTWGYSDLNEYVYVSGLCSRTGAEIWGTAGRNANSFITSKDSLVSWKLIGTPDSLKPWDIDFADSLHGIAVGEAGYVFRYIPDEPVSVEQIKADMPVDFSLEQNYPNPFNPVTIIQYAVIGRQFVTLKIYDILGNQVATLVNEYKDAGTYLVEFNPESGIKNPASGIYFYQLNAGNYVETKKMVLLK